MSQFFTGHVPSKPDTRDAHLLSFVDETAVAAALPTLPTAFGHGNDFAGEAWRMLGNGPLSAGEPETPASWVGFKRAGGAGNCEIAGAAHETMEDARNTGRTVPVFTPQNAIEGYSTIGGTYDPVSGNGDNGLETRSVLKYRQGPGLLDPSGVRHKIGPYFQLQAGNVKQLKLGMFLFTSVGFGGTIQASFEQQFNEGKTIKPVAGSEELGGHYVPFMGTPGPGYLTFITWAKRTVCTDAWYEKNCQEAWAYISPEQFKAVTGKTYEGYDAAQLEEYIKLVTKALAS